MRRLLHVVVGRVMNDPERDANRNAGFPTSCTGLG
jgi:hypothetical protein